MSKVKHIALIKFKGGTTEQQIEQVFQEILDLTESIEGVEDYVSGSNNSPETLSQGYTHGLVMSFSDAAARDAYLANPDHEKLKQSAMPHVDQILVFDFEV
jgi:hypothetical protein